MRKQKGTALLIAIVIFALIFSAGVYFLRFAALEYKMSAYERDSAMSFYAAEAGIEWAKSRISSNPDWYTDLPHSSQDDKTWLFKDSKGFVLPIGESRFKVVREHGKDIIYSIGYLGDNIENNRAISVIKLGFQNPPFETLSWREIL